MGDETNEDWGNDSKGSSAGYSGGGSNVSDSSDWGSSSGYTYNG